MGDIDVRPDLRVIALRDEARHFVDIIEQAQTEGLQLECDFDALAGGVIAEDAAGLDGPTPLLRRRDDLALPKVFAQDQQDVARAPLGGEINEALATFDMLFADGIIEVDEPDGHHWK